MIVIVLTIYYRGFMRTSRVLQGITLIEMILVILIGGIICAIVGSIYLNLNSNQLHEIHNANKVHKVHKVHTDENILLIENALRMYRLDNGFYPTQAQGLQALVYKPITHPIPEHWIQYLERLPKDAHGHIYRYKNSGYTQKIQVMAPSS